MKPIKLKIYLYIIVAIFSLQNTIAAEKTPLIVVTDCYHPYQDPGDNLDLIQGFALPDVDLKAIILDISEPFRKDTADHPTLWKDPRGPREGAIIQVAQLNYIFNRNIPSAYGPLTMMRSETDKMLDIPQFEQEGVELLLRVLKDSKESVEVLSFGSARVIAVAYNREPELLKSKIKRIHLSGGTASKNYELGTDRGANMIPGGEWNVALDVFAFTRMLRSDLPIALYPCAGKDGGFVKDHNNSYWLLKDMSFLKEMHPQLQAYLDYSFGQKLQYDFLRALDKGAVYKNGTHLQFNEFHIWESAIWLKATNRELVKTKDNEYKLVKQKNVTNTDQIIENSLRPCLLTEIKDEGRFQFEYTNSPSNISIYYRPNLEENEKALNEAIPQLFKSYKP